MMDDIILKFHQHSDQEEQKKETSEQKLERIDGLTAQLMPPSNLKRAK